MNCTPIGSLQLENWYSKIDKYAMSPKIYNILVFPGGTEIGLEIQRALCDCKQVKLFSGGRISPDHAPYVFAQHNIVPGTWEPGWLSRLNQVLEENQIDYIFPAYDNVLVALAQNRDQIKAKVITSPLETVLITRAKLDTYKLFADRLPVPDQYDIPGEIDCYPVFVKPNRGQGSQDTHLISNPEELRLLLKDHEKDYIVLEYLPGEEYTVDCLTDREKGLLFCGGRRRIRTKGGISMNSRPVKDDIFQKYAQLIMEKLVFHGAWFFQLKRDRSGVLNLLEIAPRIAGTMAVHRVMGINFPLLSLYEQERIPIEISINPIEVEIDRALINRYRHNVHYKTVYIDLDDTLILNGKVNLKMIGFIYQCINTQIRISLLTRHENDLEQTLCKHRLSNLFDQIILVKPGECKADFILEDDAIFIDDSFRERLSVRDQRGIYTFDSSMVEMLIDERA